MGSKRFVVSVSGPWTITDVPSPVPPTERLRLELEPLWAAALRDAGIAEHEVRLYPSSGAPAGRDPWAVFVDPGDDIYRLAGHQFYFTPTDAEDSRRHRHLGQVAIWNRAEPAELLGILRHELQHAIQKRDDPAAALVNGMVGVGIERAFGSPTRRAIHDLLPAERDANHHAGKLAAAQFGEPTLLARSGPHAVVLNPPPDPPDFAELGRRSLALAALAPISFGAAYPHPVPPEVTAERRAVAMARIVMESSATSSRWTDMVNSNGWRQRREDLLAAAVFAEQSGRREPWEEVRGMVLDAERAGLETLQGR